jgi:hypothetical protein
MNNNSGTAPVTEQSQTVKLWPQDEKTVNSQNQGITGLRFLIIVAITLTLGFVWGFMLKGAPDLTETLKDIGAYFEIIAVKFAVGSVITLLLSWIVFYHVLDTPLDQLRKKFREDKVNAYGFLMVGILGTVVVMLVGAQGATFNEYLFGLLTRGTVGLGIATLLTIIVARIFGCRSMDGFRDSINTGNDVDAILVSGALVIGMFFAMYAA